MTLSFPNIIQSTHASSAYKSLELRKTNDALLEFWLPYMQRSLQFYVPLNEYTNFRIEPYYGSVFNEYDIVGQSYFIELDFGSDETVTVSFPRTLLTLVLGNYLDPLLPEHFDEMFVCNIIEMIFSDIFTNIKFKTGIIVRFYPFSGVHDNFKSQWRLYVNDDSIFYPILIIGRKTIVEDLLKRLFIQAVHKPAICPLAELRVVSLVRKISINKLRDFKLGQIIILMTKRHPINEPLVLIGNKIVLHTVLQDMALHLTQDPAMIYEVEELNMTVHDDDINALPELEMSDNELNVALNDYKVTVTFEISRLEIPVNVISELKQGSVINLQKPITDDIFLTVSGRTIAIGEVVQIGRNFGVLIKEVF